MPLMQLSTGFLDKIQCPTDKAKVDAALNATKVLIVADHQKTATSERADLVLPPGATEAECLRASRRMPLAEDRQSFARIVRTWQYAAYAGRLPDDDAFESLASTLQQQFRWRG